MEICQRSCVLTIASLVSTLAIFPLSSSQADDTIQPGQWRTKEEVLEMINPLLDPKMIEKRKSKPMTVEFCVSSNSLQALVIGKEDKLGLCNGPIDIGKGKISIQITCTTGLGKSTQKIDGTYTSTKIERTRESITDSPKGQIHTKTRAVLERIGECKP